MADRCFLLSLKLTGFRAYLHPKEFDFSKKRCLVVFAPNGNGKSSIADGLEFVLSKEGTLGRLGQRAINNQAGPLALAHNLAEESGIVPTVSINIICGEKHTSGSRDATGSKREMPAAAAMLNSHLTVTPVIRGYELRAFVENHTPEQRYADVANWLQLGPLVEVQKNIRSLRTLIKAAAEDDSALKRLDFQVSKETDQVVTTWELAGALSYINSSVLRPLDSALALSALKATDPVYIEVESRARAEADNVGLAGLRQMRSAASALWSKSTNEETDEIVITGLIPAFEEAIEALSNSTVREAEERGKAANTAFQALWKAAEPVFAEGVAIPDACPVCGTPILDTAAGSGDAIRSHIVHHLDELADYANAVKALEDARNDVYSAHTRLLAALPGLIGFLGENQGTLATDLAAYQSSLTSWPDNPSMGSTGVAAGIEKLIKSLDRAINEIEERQGEHTYAKAKAKIDRLLELQTEREVAVRTHMELGQLSEALKAQGATISAEIRKKVRSLLELLQAPMNEIYRLIQGANAKTIRLELPAEDEANQQRLNLLVDFAENRTNVQPSGYLSDSQIHSVALALRMAAIMQFNPGAPIMALDDIVTSYDADHRRAIAALIAKISAERQILITTHDERFFNYLKDQLEPNAWHFTRIIGLDPSYGPRFADDKVTDDMIEDRWSAGKSAANEIRQAEEEWLLTVCRDFGVSVRIRSLERAYSYERSELASALAGFLKNAKLQPALVPGVNNRFLGSLVKGEIENFGSHFQDVPYGDGSIGDEKVRWEEFKTFRAQFACKKCKRTRFQRPVALKKPVCAHSGCETQFAFCELETEVSP